MKTAEPKPSPAASHQKAASSFFGKREGSFFNGESTKEINSFFNSPQSSYRLFNGSSIQTKLTIGQPNDKYEQEADHMADKVVQRLSQNGPSLGSRQNNIIQTSTDNNISRLPSTPLQMKCAECEQDEKLQKKEEEDVGMPKEKIQKKPIFESNTEPPDDDHPIQRKCGACGHDEILQKKQDICSSISDSSKIESDLATSKGSGVHLPDTTRKQMEFSFGADFGNVKIHNNGSAVQMNKDLQAQAFTHGSDIYFNSGKYDANSKGGQHLLAHELTHVVQQNKQQQRRTPDVQTFTTREHTDIGNEAYQLVKTGFAKVDLKNSPLANTLREGSRFQIGKRSVNYGDIVADGDFFENFEELIKKDENRPGFLGSTILATRNVVHFTPNNIILWKVQHEISINEMVFAHDQLAVVNTWIKSLDGILERAREAIINDDQIKAEKWLTQYSKHFEARRKEMEGIIKNSHETARRALMRNAFAEHFLTDAFSGGHIVTPREEILLEAKVALQNLPSKFSLVRGAAIGSTWGELPELRAQARSLAWHDLDNFYGVMVRGTNPAFGSWTACGDGCSDRTMDPHWQRTRAMVIQAASESIKHLWEAGLNGIRPINYKSVLDLVPRPTWEKYPAWGQKEWENQLNYIRGDSSAHVSGAQMTPFAVDLHPIEHCANIEIGCYDSFVGTKKDWIQQFNFNDWVLPWINKIKNSAASRYNF